MKIEAVKVTSKKTSAAAPSSVTESVEKDIQLTKAWLGFRSDLVKYFEEVKTVAVELQFESSYDEKNHHNFNADEAVFVSDVQVCPKGNVVFIVPYGVKDKSFHYAEAELINSTDASGNTEPLNTTINRLFRSNFTEFSDINSVTMLERKYLGPMAGLGAILNDGEEFLKKVELNKDRLNLYSKIQNFGIF
jgi:hypothetical protein